MGDTATWRLRHYDRVEHGPFQFSAIISAAAAGNVAADTQVIHPKHTGGEWIRARRVKKIAEACPTDAPPKLAAPPVTQTHVPPPSPKTSRIESSQDGRIDIEADSPIASEAKSLWSSIGHPVKSRLLAKIGGGVYLFSLLSTLILFILSMLAVPEYSIPFFVGWIFIVLVVPILCVAAFGIWTLPIIVAYLRDHPNIIPISIVTIFFGWSMAGWVVSFAWSFSKTATT